MLQLMILKCIKFYFTFNRKLDSLRKNVKSPTESGSGEELMTPILSDRSVWTYAYII